MSDDPTSDALSRASAYLDGELDAPEIAAVEADPEVMAEVARLRSLQHEIRDVPAPSPYGRDMAVAAALAEFDTVHRAVPAVTPMPSVRTARRPSYGRWMAVAAAIAGVAALGAVITTAGRNGGDGDDAAVSPEESAVAFDVAATERSSGGGAPAAPQPEAELSQPMLASEATESPAATALGGDAGQAAAAEEADDAAPATTATASEALPPIQFDPTTPIPDELALGVIGRQLLSEWRNGLRVTKTGTSCDATVPEAVLLTDALLNIDGVDRPVLIAGNPADDTISALDPDTCVVVVTGR
jgi:hypothetical protein